MPNAKKGADTLAPFPSCFFHMKSFTTPFRTTPLATGYHALRHVYKPRYGPAVFPSLALYIYTGAGLAPALPWPINGKGPSENLTDEPFTIFCHGQSTNDPPLGCRFRLPYAATWLRFAALNAWASQVGTSTHLLCSPKTSRKGVL